MKFKGKFVIHNRCKWWYRKRASPGYINTWGMTKEEKKHTMDNTLLKKVGHPIDIVKGILFLASDEAAYIAGKTIDVDGGSQLFW